MANDFFKKLFFGENISIVGLTCFSIGLTFVGFISCFIISLAKRGYSIKKRLWFVPLGVSAMVFQLMPCVVQKNYQTLFLVGGVFLICLAVLLALPTREIQVLPSQRKLIRELDAKVDKQSIAKTENINSNNNPHLLIEDDENEEKPIRPSVLPFEKTPSPTIVRPFFEENIKTPSQKKVTDIDFSHVKKIIARLKEIELSPSEKKQISELEASVNQAERVEYSTAVKSKINSGLGAVLKIMSKYGA